MFRKNLILFEPINGNALLWWRYGNYPLQTPCVCGVHTYGGRCFLSQFLFIMNSNKNENNLGGNNGIAG